MIEAQTTIHEVDFCSQVASAVNILVQQDSKFSPIREARVEGYGTGAGRLKRKDLRFFDDLGRLILCGEVKLPGTPEGRSPYDAKLCEDARQRAENARIRFFFTWNVNTFVLWDLRLWDRPLLEKRVSEWRLDRNLRDPEDVAREDNLRHIKSQFLPLLMADVADIISERRKDWSLPPDDIFIRSLESHLDWPVQLLSAYILEQSDQNKTFGSRVEQWMAEQDWIFVRSPREEWIKAVDNMAKTLAYVWTNRLIFYKALLARFPGLPRLELRASAKNPEDAVIAYYLKRGFDPARSHLDLIGELFGCDIAMYPAHLATLNLAAREISDEANYPRCGRRQSSLCPARENRKKAQGTLRSIG